MNDFARWVVDYQISTGCLLDSPEQDKNVDFLPDEMASEIERLKMTSSFVPLMEKS